MQGRIFLSYRREDTSGYAIALYHILCEHFDRSQIFMDVDTLEPGEDFVEVIENAVSSCDVLIALIGKRWLSSSDESGRRIENAYDWVRLEIAAALKSGVRVVPVLVDGAIMPKPDELPEALSSLARRHAFELRHARFSADANYLISKLARVLSKEKPVAVSEKPLTSIDEKSPNSLERNVSNAKSNERVFQKKLVQPAGHATAPLDGQRVVDQKYAHFDSWADLVGEEAKELTGKGIARQVYQERVRRIQRDGKPARTHERFDYLGRAEKREYYLAVDRLPEMLRRSGLGIRLISPGSLPLVPDLSDHEVEQLARLEHDRFKQYWTVVEGWTHGPELDPVRQTSPYLVAYDELPATARVYYRETVHAISVALSEQGFEVHRLAPVDQVDDPILVERLAVAYQTDVIEPLRRGRLSPASRLQYHLSPAELNDLALGGKKDMILAVAGAIPKVLRSGGYAIKPLERGNKSVFIGFDESRIEKMAETEHTLWKWGMVMLGWIYRAEKNPAQKASPFIVPWTELPSEPRELTRRRVRRIPNLVAESGYEIFKE